MRFPLALLSAALLAAAPAYAGPARVVLSTDFGSEWPLTTYSAAVNCLHGNQAVLIADEGVYAINGIAKSFADKHGYRDIGEISKPHPDFPEVDAAITPLLQVALEMC